MLFYFFSHPNHTIEHVGVEPWQALTLVRDWARDPPEALISLSVSVCEKN